MKALKCDDCGTYYERTISRSAYYRLRDGVGSFYALKGHLDLCDKCWNKMLKEVTKQLEAKDGRET